MTWCLLLNFHLLPLLTRSPHVQGATIEPLPIREGDVPPEILVIGDSITSALAVSPEQGGEPIPFGVLNAFHFVAQRLLLEGDKPTKVSIDFVGYPGLALVRPTEEEQLKGFPSGMIDAFFWVSRIWIYMSVILRILFSGFTLDQGCIFAQFTSHCSFDWTWWVFLNFL